MCCVVQISILNLNSNPRLFLNLTLRSGPALAVQLLRLTVPLHTLRLGANTEFRGQSDRGYAQEPGSGTC